LSSASGSGRSAAGRALTERPALRGLIPGTPANRLLRTALLLITLIATVPSFYELLQTQPRGVDLEIPLRAAQRWIDGSQPYLASAFQVKAGPDLPFLYPPFVLPFVTPLLALPRELVLWTWVGACLLGAVWGLHRLHVPYRWMPLILMSPPFAEGIIGGNVQVLLFAAFVAMFYRRDWWAPAFHPTHDDPADPGRSRLGMGTLGATIAALKISQVHAWAYLLIRRPSSALLGAAVIGAVVLVTLPITGLAIWSDWLAQVQRAADPNWKVGGLAIRAFVPAAVAAVVTALTLLALFWVPRRTAGTWVGVLAVLGAPSLHIFGLLFMVPAWLLIRRELGLIAAFFFGWFTEPGVWIGVAIIAATWTAGATRWPVLLEPGGEVGPEPVEVPQPSGAGVPSGVAAG
jgi:hypothetical protein